MATFLVEGCGVVMVVMRRAQCLIEASRQAGRQRQTRTSRTEQIGLAGGKEEHYFLDSCQGSLAIITQSKWSCWMSPHGRP